MQTLAGTTQQLRGQYQRNTHLFRMREKMYAIWYIKDIEGINYIHIVVFLWVR